MGICRRHGCNSVIYGINYANYPDGRATTLGIQPDLWVWGSQHSVLSLRSKCGIYHRPHAGNWYSSSIFQLWGLFLMVVHHPAFYFYKTGFEQAAVGVNFSLICIFYQAELSAIINGKGKNSEMTSAILSF
jgi:hypothetical protein